MAAEEDNSLGGEATHYSGKSAVRPQPADVSLGDERTLGAGDAAGFDTVIGDIEVVNLEARYKIEGTLGQGGMGAVLLATDTRLGRKVAIKRILGEAARSKTAIMRFLTEAKAIAALNHPNIVQIYDYGRAKDGPFLIMEYVDGGSLLERCRESALPLDQAIELSCQLCDGLAKAHDLGIIHRDIKPANVLLTKDGIPKLTDFGLAKAEASDHGQTVTGAVLGTPDFMPPEQRRDASLVDHRSDLWSLAATVYQMLTGRSPKIIRFDLVPAELTKVLGKALEDVKEARYQSAREFRDAIKTSLRTAAAGDELIEGACPACGIKNDSSRRFCRGCGESLEAPCLSCMKPMPMWEEICGSCGAKQAPLVGERRLAMAVKQADAEGLLGDCEFDRAMEIATQLSNEAHPKLKHLSGWGASFLEQIEKSRAEQTRHAVEAIAEANKHEAEHDYLSAHFALEMVPESLRTGVLPGMQESAGAMLDRIKKMQREARGLETRIKERLAAKQLDELLPDVERLLALQPDRRDLQKIRVQLLERQQKQARARDNAIELANANIASHDYEGALAALSGVAPAMVSLDVVTLREQSEGLLSKVRGLRAKIKEAVAAKQVDGLLGTVEQYLELNPADAEIEKLRQSLVEQEEKYSANIAARLKRAEQLEQACRFDEAKKLLAVIPEPRRTQRIAACLGRASLLGPARQKAMGLLTTAKSAGYSAAIESSRLYESALADAGFIDTEFSRLLAHVRATLADHESTRKTLRRIGIAVAALAAVVTVAAAGVWIRASARAFALANALQSEAWDSALAIEPGNVAALVGRSRKKLQAAPPDVAGAFADLDRAERGLGTSPEVKAVLGDGHAIRAREHALANRLDLAAEDLAEAKQLGGSVELVAAAKAALGDGHAIRAREHALANRLDVVAKDLAEAKRLGGSAELVAAARETLLQLGEAAASKADFTVARKAYELLATVGVPSGALSVVQAKAHLMQAAEMLRNRDEDAAVRSAFTAMDFDSEATLVALQGDQYAGLRTALVQEVRRRFVSSVKANDLPMALKWASQASIIDSEMAAWVAGELAERAEQFKEVPPVELAALPKQVIEMLPVPLLSRLPTSVLVRLPARMLSALPGTAIEELPDEIIVTLSAEAIASLKLAVLNNLARRHGSLWPNESADTSERSALGKALLDKFHSAVSRSNHEEAKAYCELVLFCDSRLRQQLINEGASFNAKDLPAFSDNVLQGLVEKHETLQKPITNSVGMVLQQLPGWVFMMGDAQNGPIHPVVITKPFSIGVTEVTNAEFEKVMGPGIINRCQGRVGRYGAEGTAYCGVRPACVSWEEAVQFCEKLSAERVEKRNKRSYRLPTEAEWEYACRAGSNASFCYGDNPANLREYANFQNQTAIDPVGCKKPNTWGLFDMHGNAAEWCSDWFGAYENQVCVDPTGTKTGAKKVHRGGSASWSADGCTSARRFSELPGEEKGYIGFRVVMIKEAE